MRSRLSSSCRGRPSRAPERVTQGKGTTMRNMKRMLLGLAVAGLVVGQGPGASAAPGPDPGGFDGYDVITEFDPGAGGAFAESMAPDGHGGMVVSVTTWGIRGLESGWTSNTGQLWKVGPDGSKAKFGPEIDLSPTGMLMGVAVDERGAVFVALNNFGSDYEMAEDPPSGVLRVTPEGFERVMTLPEAVYANGLAVNDRTLYVTDSMGGSIWEGPSGSVSTPDDPVVPLPAARTERRSWGERHRILRWRLVRRVLRPGPDPQGSRRSPRRCWDSQAPDEEVSTRRC